MYCNLNTTAVRELGRDKKWEEEEGWTIDGKKRYLKKDGYVFHLHMLKEAD